MKNNTPWIEKYRPKNLNEMLGNEKMSNNILTFLNNFNSKQENKMDMTTRDRALLLIGHPGIGKTTVVRAICAAHNYDIKETNASDTRNKTSIQEIIGDLNKNVSILSFTHNVRNKIIFIDEVDGIAGNEDRGGLAEIIKLIETTSFPIILACNFRNEKIDKLEKIATVIDYEVPKKETIFQLLSKIVESENLKCDKKVLEIISRNANGDFRAAINDLQLHLKNNSPNAAENIQSYRDTMMSETEMLKEVINAVNIEDSLYYLQISELTYTELLKKMGDALISLPDVGLEEMTALITSNTMLQHILRESNYKMLGYYFKYIASIAPYREEKNNVLNFPTIYWKRRKKIDNTAIKKLQKVYPVDSDTIYTEIIPLLKLMSNKKNDEFKTFMSNLNISENEWRELIQTK